MVSSQHQTKPKKVRGSSLLRNSVNTPMYLTDKKCKQKHETIESVRYSSRLRGA